MKIGEWELDGSEESEANEIVSGFLNSETKIIEGNAPSGRAGKEDKNYCLTTSIKNNVGIKLPYNKISDPEVEFLVNEVRELLGVTGYKTKKIDGFPMDHDKWKRGNVLITDWGPEGARTNLRELNSSDIAGDEIVFLKEFASNAAISCFLGLWDREPRNFVWDKNLKKIISIDHETLSKKLFDVDVFSSLSKVMKKFFGDSWYDTTDLKLQFEGSFSSTWYEMGEKKAEIIEIYKKNNFTYRKNLVDQRLERNPSFPLSNIMM